MRAKPISRKSRTDLRRLDAVTDKQIGRSDIPEVSPSRFERAVVRRGLKPVPGKKQVTLRVDGDVLGWFRHQGPGYQTRINQLLRAYMDAHRP
jgi:uncharacterized protein (DUF4415 family)